MVAPASIATLVHAVRIPVVLEYLGQLALVLAALEKRYGQPKPEPQPKKDKRK